MATIIGLPPLNGLKREKTTSQCLRLYFWFDGSVSFTCCRSLSAMMQLELPHINVLSKIDMVMVKSPDRAI